MTLRFATPSIVLFLTSVAIAACATSNENSDLPPPKKQADAAATKDTSDETSTGDGSVTDSAPLDMGSCSPLTSDTKPCGKCGTKTRTCSSGGTWNEWSSCSGEMSFAECSIDEVRANPCGNCGTQKDTCDPTSCTWSSGVCLGEGVCEIGTTETSTASCATVGEVRTRTCSDKCAWGAYSECTLPKGWLKMAAATGAEGRIWHSAVWTGSKMIVWGGYGTYVGSSYVKNSGVAYNMSGDTWAAIAAPPSTLVPRWHHSAVWTGSQMIVWGGNVGTSYSSYSSSSYYTGTGAVYDPSTNTWPKSTSASPLTPRFDHVAVWSTTTNEMLVWGGMAYGSTYAAAGDGAAYNPATDTWTAIPAGPLSPRYRANAVWTGTELIIWGGLSLPTSTYTGLLRDGARYDPKTKVWTKFPDPPAEIDGRWDTVQVWSGKELLVFGGVGSNLGAAPYYGRNDGARYLPGGSWTRFTVPSDDIFATGTSAARAGIQAWFGGGKLFMWGGAPPGSSSSYAGANYPLLGGGGFAVAGGVTYDPSTDKWTALDLTDAPTTRAHASVVWTGKEAIIWGGSSYGNAPYSGGTYFADGAIYRP